MLAALSPSVRAAGPLAGTVFYAVQSEPHQLHHHITHQSVKAGMRPARKTYGALQGLVPAQDLTSHHSLPSASLPVPADRGNGAKLWCLGADDSHLRVPFFLKLAEQGFQITALGTGDPRPFSDHGVKYVGYTLNRFLHPLGNLHSLRQLVDLIREQRPDIVHGFDTKPALLAPMAVARAGVGRAIQTINGLGYLFSSRSPLALCLRPVYRGLHRHVAPKTAMTIFQNEQDRAYFEAHGLMMPGRSRLIRGSGVDLTDFAARTPDEGELARLRHELDLVGRRVVTTVSRLTRQKGIVTLLEAAARLATSHPDVVVLLVGPREGEGPLAVSRKAIDRHAPYVRALGRRDDVPAILALTDVFVLPTQYREGLPRALLEAGAAGRPVVATRMPGCVDVVRNGHNGFLVEPGDPRALADAIATLLEYGDLRRSMGERNLALIRAHFSMERVIDAHAAVYEDVLGASRLNRLRDLGTK